MSTTRKGQKVTEPPKVQPHGDIKIAESQGFLNQIKRATDDIITKIRTHTDDLENKRRIQEEKMRKERANKIQTEVITSHKKNVEIDWTWQELEEKEDCEELARDIEVQKEACKQIIEQKDVLIKQFIDQLKNKDEEYIKAIKQQNDDIDQLIEAMRKQFNDMRQDYHDQIEYIEAAFIRERSEIIQRNGEEIAQLFAQHSKLETDYMAKKGKCEDNYLEQLEKIRTQDANDQAEQKIKLEKEMQILQKCMEDMKAVYKLNEAKLEFNLEVLQQRQKVNENTKNGLKKRRRKFIEVLRTVKEKFDYELNQYAKTNAHYTKDYKRFTKEFLLLQRKYERFEKSDKNRFNEIWSMNQNEVMALCEKIKDCDRVIHVQQLGIAWQPPSDPIFQQFEGGAQGIGQSMTGGQNTSVMDSSKHGMSKSDFVDDGQMSHAKSHATGQEEASDIKDNFFKVKNVFQILMDEAPYLIDDKAIQMVEGKSQKEQFLIKIDSIRKSLGIEAMEDVQLLVDTFYEFGPKKREQLALEAEKRKKKMEEDEAELMAQPTGNKKDDKNQKKGANGKNEPAKQEVQDDEEEVEEKDPTKPDIDMDDVVEVLQEFHRKREERMNSQEGLMGNPSLKKKSNFQTEEQKVERQKREERIFWEKMTKVLSDKNHAVWRALDKALTKYYALLVDRQNLIEETGLLNQQNEELKTLLNQYLQAGVNHDLQVPPTQVIRLDI